MQHEIGLMSINRQDRDRDRESERERGEGSETARIRSAYRAHSHPSVRAKKRVKNMKTVKYLHKFNIHREKCVFETGEKSLNCVII